MGEVYVAYDDELDRRVALKLVHESGKPGHRDRMRREAQALAKLAHPNVVAVYEVGSHSGGLFIAMELVHGRTLREWTRDEAPAWRDTLTNYLQAARGLAAAHAAGLVHRDFKPDNAIVGDDGRVRVLDFGLVRRDAGGESDATASRTATDEAAPTERGERALDVAMTDDGALMGTPAYMAPEQFLGEDSDARTDQFALCVALYEAVYGTRPFKGGARNELASNVTRGLIEPAPKGSDVPAWLRAAVVRGLSPRREDRWPSLDALLEELDRRIAPRRRGWLAVGLAGGLATAGLGLWKYAGERGRCEGAREQLAEVWNDAQRDAVRSSILGTELSYAPATAQRVEARLDAYGHAWADKHTAACEATRVTQEQSEEELGLRMGCLRRRRAEMAAVVTVLAEADDQVVREGVVLASGLPDLGACDDLDRLRRQRQRVPPPDDEDTAREVEVLRGRLARVTTEQRAGRYTRALEQLAPVAERAQALGYGPLEVEVQLRRGQLQMKNGHYAQAEAELLEAHASALALGHDEAVADAARALAFVVGYKLERHAEGLVWGRTALPLAERSGDASLLASTLSDIASVRLGQGEYAQAETRFRRALEIREEATTLDHPAIATAIGNLGAALLRRGKLDDAERHLRRALEIRERELGPEHPGVALTLSSLAIALEEMGRYEEEEAMLRRALRIQEAAVGPDHPDVALAFNNLGNAMYSMGRFDDALTAFQRGHDIHRAALGAEHPEVAGGLNNVGTALEKIGEVDEALRSYRRAGEIWKRALGPDHPNVAMALGNVGNVLQGRGELEEAERTHRRVLEITRGALGDEHPATAHAMESVGNVLVTRGAYDDAEPFLRQVLQSNVRNLGDKHPSVAKAKVNLAALHAGRGELDDARHLLASSLHTLETAMGPEHPNLSYPLLALTDIELDAGNPAAARGHAERTVSILSKADAMPGRLARARLSLARALWDDPTERNRARGLARQARDAHAALGEEASVAEATAWLDRHAP